MHLRKSTLTAPMESSPAPGSPGGDCRSASPPMPSSEPRCERSAVSLSVQSISSLDPPPLPPRPGIPWTWPAPSPAPPSPPSPPAPASVLSASWTRPIVR
ncbi:MAG: hypothetical protein FJ149_11740 [Euryarchaeota archaeon]|nr:hypothetical protein [Euryarchaeota archaeon]